MRTSLASLESALKLVTRTLQARDFRIRIQELKMLRSNCKATNSMSPQPHPVKAILVANRHRLVFVSPHHRRVRQIDLLAKSHQNIVVCREGSLCEFKGTDVRFNRLLKPSFLSLVKCISVFLAECRELWSPVMVFSLVNEWRVKRDGEEGAVHSEPGAARSLWKDFCHLAVFFMATLCDLP